MKMQARTHAPLARFKTYLKVFKRRANEFLYGDNAGKIKFHPASPRNQYVERIASEHFLNLVKIAASDGEIHPKEFEFLIEIGIDCGFTQSELQYIVHNPQDHELVLPTDTAYTHKLLGDLIRMALADGEITEVEMNRLERHSDLLLISRVDLKQMILGFRIGKSHQRKAS